jgi:hypothetical protein
MTTATPGRETLERASAIFAADRTLDWATAVARAAAQLEAENAEEAERMAKAKEFTDSLAAFWSCGCCGANAGPGARDGVCSDCRAVVASVHAERRASSLVNGRTRRELAEAYLDLRERLEAS